MRKTTAGILIASLVGLVVYVSVLSAALVRDLNSAHSATVYSSGTNADTTEPSKLEVASTSATTDGRTQAAKVTRHHRNRALGRHPRIKSQKDGVTLMI